MITQEGASDSPVLYIDESLRDYVGSLCVDKEAIVDLSAEYGMTLDQLGVKAIRFSTYDTEYDPDNGTLTLGVLKKDAPPSVVHPSRQHRSTLAHRSVPARNRPHEYFTVRSKELSRTLASVVAAYATDAGYQSQALQDLHSGRSSVRALGGIVTLLVGAGGMYEVHKGEFLDSVVGGGMTVGGVAFVGLMYWAGVSMSQEQEDRDAQALIANEVLDAYDRAPTNLIRVAPLELARFTRSSSLHAKSRKNRRPIAWATGRGIRAGKNKLMPHSNTI